MAERTIEDVMALAPVIPVLTVADVAHAVPLAQALVRCGLPALEITLRTGAALEAIAAYPMPCRRQFRGSARSPPRMI